MDSWSWNGRVVKASDLNFQTHHLVFHRVGSNPASSEFLHLFVKMVGKYFCILSHNFEK
jgi:hypothetical protein